MPTKESRTQKEYTRNQRHVVEAKELESMTERKIRTGKCPNGV